MTSIKRHVGRIQQTDKRCVVLMLQLQDENGNIIDAEHCMIVDTDALPDRLHQPLMHILDSVEGQQEQVLAKLLARRAGPDAGVDMFSSLAGKLSGVNYVRKMHVDQILMYPEPNRPIPLRAVLEALGTIRPGANEQVVEQAWDEKFNPHNHNSAIQNSEESVKIASNLLREAEDFQALANQKREAAYKVAPQLRPTTEAASPKGKKAVKVTPDVAESEAQTGTG